MRIIDKLNFPEDVKNLNPEETKELCEDLRKFLIESVSKTGGHLSSNLGVVDLTVSLFKVFDFKKDKIVWDVGHQSYVYKILTGRKDGFKELKKFNGMSGFPKRSESKYDYFDTGHSSTSISAGLGIARARDLKHEDYSVISVIGDGALTGGMAFEALNDVGYRKTNMIIILNDNQMSISHNVGGISKALNRLRMAPRYNRLKMDINESLNQSKVGKNIAGKISKVKDSLKQLVVPSMLFESMGIKYIGPIDGHNVDEMTEVLLMAKEIKGPVIIHTLTQKGKGYTLAEQSPTKYHGIAPFDLESGEPKVSSKNNYSKVFGKAMVKLADENENIVAISAAMPEGTGLNEFAKVHKNRFFDVGIAEQHAVTLAAGMASNGLKPVFAVYSTFLQRAFDQVIHDVCIQKLPVVFAIDRAGIVGEDGETHQGIYDLSYLSLIPNLEIVAPKCLEEVEAILRYALTRNTPVAIRYPRGGNIVDGLVPIKEIKCGKWEVLTKGLKVCIIATGRMVQHAKIAMDMMYERGINPMFVNATFIKPIDKQLLNTIIKENYNVITIEDNILHGGLGSTIEDYLVQNNYKGKIKCLGYNDIFVPQGNVDILYREYNLDCESICEATIELY